MAFDPGTAQRMLEALGEQLAGAEPLELVVIGGSGLAALGLIDRSTRDIDLVALRHGQTLVDPRPLPERLIDARGRVAADFGLPEEWLNAAPASLLDFGLPRGFVERLERRQFGPSLIVWLASRIDQIHFKLYAVADQGPGKHEADLRSGFREVLVEALQRLGVSSGHLGT